MPAKIKTVSDQIAFTPNYRINEWNLPKGIVLLDGEGHTWIALEYEQITENPPVLYLVSGSGQHINIADNFADFSQKMVLYEDVYDEDGNLRKASSLIVRHRRTDAPVNIGVGITTIWRINRGAKTKEK